MEEGRPYSAGTRGRIRAALPWLALVAAGLLLHGCGARHLSLPSSPTPVPREREAQPAARSLLRNAEQALNAGNARQADEYLERAIRIDPQNPEVWHVLARSRFQQKQYPQAIQLLLKSNSFRPDRATERSNWLLMENAYRAMGDVQKAEQARTRASN